MLLTLLNYISQFVTGSPTLCLILRNNNLFILYSPPFSPGPRSDASCELCGFYFENRKALASHARAHLRQFGVTEWCVNGSPIETLSAWMRTRPQKVLEMHRSYMQVNRSSLKKVPPPPFRKVQQGTT